MGSGQANRAGELSQAIRRVLRHVLLGPRFVRTLERNRDAADRLDMALKEMLERP